jgi:hypothetical protein
VRPEPSDDPTIELMEALSDVGATVVVSPSSDDRVDRLDQFAQTQRYTPHGQGPDLILELVHRLLCGNGIEILPVQFRVSLNLPLAQGRLAGRGMIVGSDGNDGGLMLSLTNIKTIRQQPCLEVAS